LPNVAAALAFLHGVLKLTAAAAALFYIIQPVNGNDAHYLFLPW
jgi:hypothetical protein